MTWHQYANQMPPRHALLHASRMVLDSKTEYDPANARMDIKHEDRFKYHVSLALWDIALRTRQ